MIHLAEDMIAQLSCSTEDAQLAQFTDYQPVTYLVDILLALHHTHQGVVEPVLELGVTSKDLRHQEVHEGPQLHQVILQWSTCRDTWTFLLACRPKTYDRSISNCSCVDPRQVFS